MSQGEKKNKDKGPSKGFQEKGGRGEFDVMKIGNTSAEGAKGKAKAGITK